MGQQLKAAMTPENPDPLDDGPNYSGVQIACALMELKFPSQTAARMAFAMVSALKLELRDAEARGAAGAVRLLDNTIAGEALKRVVLGSSESRRACARRLRVSENVLRKMEAAIRANKLRLVRSAI